MDCEAYIEEQFDQMVKLGIVGDEQLTPAERAVLKMIFISGISAALAFEGSRYALRQSLKPALARIKQQHGGRTIYPLR